MSYRSRTAKLPFWASFHVPDPTSQLKPQAHKLPSHISAGVTNAGRDLVAAAVRFTPVGPFHAC